MLIERLSDNELLRFTIEKRGHWYYVNAYGRTSKRGAWRHIWIERVFISYLKAHTEFTDTGAALFDFRNQISVTQMAA